MKGACIITSNGSFTEWAAPILKDEGYQVSLVDTMLHLKDSDRLMLIYPDKNADGSCTTASELEDLEKSQLVDGKDYIYLVECRWEDLFCQIVKILGKSGPDSFRVLDNENKVLRPEEVDPATICL